MHKILNPIVTTLEGVEMLYSDTPEGAPVKLSAKIAFQAHIGFVRGSGDTMKTLALGLKLAALDDYVEEIDLEDAELELLSQLLKNLRNAAFSDIVFARLEQVLDKAAHLEKTS